MKRYFWREKNADLFLGKNEVILPTREELEEELVKKLAQKVERLIMIYNKKARELYFSKDEKANDIKLENLSEKEIQKIIGFNVAVDFLQLIKDLCLFYNIKVEKPLKGNQIANSFEELATDIYKQIENLLKKTQVVDSIQAIYNSIFTLSEMLDLSFNEIEEQQIKREEKQGSFYKGKYVIK